jgi:hypothetical protein
VVERCDTYLYIPFVAKSVGVVYSQVVSPIASKHELYKQARK